MKTLLALVLVLVLGWLGATWYVGSQAEQLVREEVANLEVLPGQKDIILDVLTYHRGLFSSRAVTCLIIQGDLAAMKEAAALSGKLCANSTIHHGPLAWTGDSLFIGLAATEEVLDLSVLPPQGKALVDEIFQGQPPLTGSTRYGFDGSVSAKVAVSPARLESPMGKLALDQLSLDVWQPGPSHYPVNSFLTLKGLNVSSPKMGMAVESLTGAVDVVSLLGGELPLTDINLTGKGLSVSQGELPMLTFDATLQGTSQDKGTTLSGTSGLWLDNLDGPALPFPMDSAYLGFDYTGFDKQALVKVNALSRELDEIQTGMMMGMMSGEGGGDLEEQLVRMQALMEEMMRVASEKLLHPGDSALELKLLADNQNQRQLTLDSRVRYLGKDGKNLTLEELDSLTKQDGNAMLDRSVEMVELSVQADMDQSLVPPPLVGKVDELVSKGLVIREGSRWSTVLQANGGKLRLNGLPISAQELNQRLESIAPSAPPAGPEDGLPAEIDPLARL